MRVYVSLYKIEVAQFHTIQTW
uniref:Uncharacterized protein n=1 Tax=Physcomitrium patens TaxID=3218 RepID=A0A2K1JD05_PHYPA|nr:hypothetical protein PHYPA_019698 [Physcomitrium patens]